MQHAPKHLSGRTGHRAPVRALALAQWLALAAATAVVAVLILTRIGDRAVGGGAPEAAPDSTTAPITVPEVLPAPTAGATTPPAADGNLLPDPGFEAGLAGWTATGGGRLDRAGPGHEGVWAARLARTGRAEAVMSVPGLARVKTKANYVATVWLRASRPGTPVELHLLEGSGRSALARDKVGLYLDKSWTRLEVVHLAHRDGDRLALEITAPGMPAGAWIEADDARVERRPLHFMSMTTTR
jgi:hypothetical protein